MRFLGIVLGLAAVMLLAACSAEETPTPVPTPAATIAGQPLVAAEVPAHVLIRNPSALKGQYIRIEGNYQQLPVLICPGDTNLSPVTWQLLSDGLMIPATGFDSALRELGAAGMALEVEGRWQYWEGPVGCGRRPQLQQVWYLAVSQILSPNPLVADAGAGDEIALAPAATTESTAAPPVVTLIPEPTFTEESEAPVVTLQPTPAATSTEAALTTPTSTTTPTAETTGSPTPTVTPWVAGTATAAAAGTTTMTPTGTITSTTPTATGTGSPQPTSDATQTPSPTATTEGEEEFLIYEDIITGMLSAGTSRSWNFVGSQNDVVTISAAPDFDLDISLDLMGPNGSVLTTRNEGGGAQPETISQYTLPESGDYVIRLVSNGSSSGEFALALSDSESEAFLIYMATLDYGFNGSGNLPEGVDFLYAFSGVTGESVTIRVEATSSSNMVLYLYSPDGVELEFVDENEQSSSGSSEELTNQLLTDTGFFTIRVGEWDFEPASFTYSLVRGQ